MSSSADAWKGRTVMLSHIVLESESVTKKKAETGVVDWGQGGSRWSCTWALAGFLCDVADQSKPIPYTCLVVL